MIQPARILPLAIVNSFWTQWKTDPIPKEADDTLMLINQTYQYRPDLLAYDLYSTPNLVVGVLSTQSQHAHCPAFGLHSRRTNLSTQTQYTT
jgi:hypothetical protein